MFCVLLCFVLLYLYFILSPDPLVKSCWRSSNPGISVRTRERKKDWLAHDLGQGCEK